jgi:hypothetical protein
MEYSPLSPLEKQIVAIATAQGSLAELCVLIDYYTDKGRVPEHFRPRHDVLQLVRALGVAPTVTPEQAREAVGFMVEAMRIGHSCSAEIVLRFINERAAGVTGTSLRGTDE